MQKLDEIAKYMDVQQLDDDDVPTHVIQPAEIQDRNY